MIFFFISQVCEEARCPNQSECWGGKEGTATATIMVRAFILLPQISPICAHNRFLATNAPEAVDSAASRPIAARHRPILMSLPTQPMRSPSGVLDTSSSRRSTAMVRHDRPRGLSVLWLLTLAAIDLPDGGAGHFAQTVKEIKIRFELTYWFLLHIHHCVYPGRAAYWWSASHPTSSAT